MILPRKQPRPILLEALPFLLMTLGAAAVLGYLGYGVLAGIAISLALFILWFFRNPNRIIPKKDNGVVCPADGKVVEVSKVYEKDLLQAEAIKIGIFMSPLDVHVNRIPCEGKVLSIHHRSGKFLSAFKESASIENEQNAVLLETLKGKRVLFVQIAGVLARRIVYWIHEGQQVQMGQPFGLIKFGSRMDLYLPVNTQVYVRPADRVKAGSTLVGVLP